MRARIKTSSPPVEAAIFLLFAIFLISQTTAQESCCLTPIFGFGKDSFDGGCTKCIKGEFIVKQQHYVPGTALGASATLLSASRIVLEDNRGIASFEKLHTLYFNATDFKSFPEPLIRVRRSEVADNAFSQLKNITIFPMDPYCQKGTFLDIDNMKQKPWDHLRKLEKDLLASCPKPTTQAPTPAPAPNVPPSSAPSSPQSSGPLSKPISTQSSSCPPVPECPSIPSAEKASEGMPIMAIAITSLCWMVITGLLLALMFFFLRRKAPPSTGFEKEFEEYAQCVALMVCYVHTTYYSLLLQHKCFLDNIINCLTAYEQRTACFLKETGAGIRTCAQLDKMDDIFAEANRRDTILGQGGTLEKTKIMENVAYRKLHFNHVSNSHDDKDIYLLVARFIESKKGRKCTETVEILAPNLEGSTKEVSKKEKDKARKKGEKEVKGNTKKENVDEEKEEKRQSAGLSLDLSVKTQENNIKRKNKIPEHVKHLDNTVAKWMNTKPNTKEEKKIADAWLSLGVIDRLLTEINETGRKFAMNYNQITFQVCRIVMNEVKERTLINNEQAYDPENPRGKIKNMHEFIHVLEHLYTDEDPQAERLKMDLTIYEWSRFLDFHYMGFDYNEHKGSLVYVRPSPMHGEPFSQAMLRLERYEKDYEKLKAKVEEYCKKKKLKLVTKKTPPKQLEIREKYDFGKYTFDVITEAAGIFEMKAEDAAKAVKASEDAKANKILDVPAPKSKAARSVMSKNSAAPKSVAPKSAAPKSSSTEPTPTFPK